METKGNNAKRRELPLYKDGCSFEGYDPSSLMAERARLRNLITKRGTLEILIPLCCSTNPVRHKTFGASIFMKILSTSNRNSNTTTIMTTINLT
jgi:hypothetical protein